MITKHSEIITRAGPVTIAEAAGVDPNNVYQWRRNDNIPSPYWSAICDASLSTLEELASAAAQKRQAEAQSDAA